MTRFSLIKWASVLIVTGLVGMGYSHAYGENAPDALSATTDDAVKANEGAAPAAVDPNSATAGQGNAAAGTAGAWDGLGRAEVRNVPLVFDPQTKKYFINGNSKFTLKQAEVGSLVERIELSVDGADYLPYNGGIQLKNEGKHSLKFRAATSINQWSPVQFTEVFVDVTPPTSEVNFSQDKVYKDQKNNVFIAPSGTIALSATDNLSGVSAIEYSWDGQDYVPYTTPITLEQKGKLSLFYRAVDKVGNVEATRKTSFVVDGTAPVTSLHMQGMSRATVINGRPYMAVNDSVGFNIDATDEGAGVKHIWVSIDNVPYSVYLTPLFFLKEGPHTLSYYAEDNVGNKEPSKGMTIWSISTPPRTIPTVLGTIVNTGGINFGAKDFALKLDAKDNVVGLDRIEVKVDNDTQFRPYLDPIRFKVAGMHFINYRSLDRAGNSEPTRTYGIQIQDMPPETKIETAQPVVMKSGVTYSPAPNIVTFNVSNSAVGVQSTLVSLNDGPFTAYQGPLTLTNQEKVYKISFKSIDKLGNEERARTVTYHMVSAVPIVDLFVTNGGNSEEKVRTNYFENSDGSAADAPGTLGQQPMPQQDAGREPASEAQDKPRVYSTKKRAKTQ